MVTALLIYSQLSSVKCYVRSTVWMEEEEEEEEVWADQPKMFQNINPRAPSSYNICVSNHLFELSLV